MYLLLERVQELSFVPQISPILTSVCILISTTVQVQLQRKTVASDKMTIQKAQQGCLPVYILVTDILGWIVVLH